MRIIGHVVTKNESNRYLDFVLSWMRECVDEIHVFDDRSEDDTVDVAISRGCTVDIRSLDMQPFSFNEGLFRQAAFEDMKISMKPEKDDWIFAFDADEILISNNGEKQADPSYAATEMRLLCHYASEGVTSFRLPIPEAFDVNENGPLIRTDGFWKGLHANRLFRYNPHASFPQVEMGCGPVPTCAQVGKVLEPGNLTLLHLGYINEQDRLAKYSRYHLRGGHNSDHIDSIITTPILEEWDGPKFNFWRGRRIVD